MGGESQYFDIWHSISQYSFILLYELPHILVYFNHAQLIEVLGNTFSTCSGLCYVVSGTKMWFEINNARYLDFPFFVALFICTCPYTQPICMCMYAWMQTRIYVFLACYGCVSLLAICSQNGNAIFMLKALELFRVGNVYLRYQW